MTRTEAETFARTLPGALLGLVHADAEGMLVIDIGAQVPDAFRLVSPPSNRPGDWVVLEQMDPTRPGGSLGEPVRS